MSIHPSSIIHPSAKIGAKVLIGPFVVVGPDTVIGDNCQIISHAVIEYTELGAGCIVYPQASLGLPPQHMGYKNEKTKLVVGSNCTFREGTTAHRGTIQDNSVTTVGKNGYFMALSHIAHDCIIGDDVILANGVQLAGHVSVGDKCFISGLVAIHQRVRIGQGAIVSGGAMVTQDVTPFALIQGDRAILRGLNLVGMKRSGINRDSIKLIKEAYQVLFYSGLTLTDALNNPLFKTDNQYISLIKNFLSDPKRGIVRPAGSSEKSPEEAMA